MLPDFDRADRIGSYYGNPATRTFRRASDRLRGGQSRAGSRRRDATGDRPVAASGADRAGWPSRSRRPTPSADEFKVSHTAITIHPPSRCEGYRCPWHNPSDHGMVGWPRDILTDRHNLLVRVCADGIGHPDPDSLEWLHRIGVADDGDHACDGCCQEARALCRRGRLLSTDPGHWARRKPAPHGDVSP
jgi:hypothetical protein